MRPGDHTCDCWANQRVSAHVVCIHVLAFIIAFSIITSFHLVIGEQAPKIFAIRRPEEMVRWCALPMKFFYYLLYPFMYVLNWATEIGDEQMRDRSINHGIREWTKTNPDAAREWANANKVPVP